MKKIAHWINKNLPVYIHVKNLKRHHSPADKGYTLAIWNCGNCKRYGKLRYVLSDIRITIRKDGLFWKTIKKGAI